MDGIFSFSEAERLDFLQSLLNTYGCTYICLWFYSSSSNRLLFLDGLCNVSNHHQQAIMISSHHQRLFDQYRGLEFDVTSDNLQVPGLVFRNLQYTCLKLQHSDLLRLASTDVQRRFFREARIKTAVFIGCGNGEIELGFSVLSQLGAEIHQTDMMMRNLFPEQFSSQTHLAELKNPSSSSSSSLRPLLSTTRSPASTTSLLFGNNNNISGTNCFLPEMLLLKQENEHDAIVKAILHVISSPSSSSDNNNNSVFHDQQNLPNIIYPEGRTSAFTRYRPSSDMSSNSKTRLSRQQSLLKRSFDLFRGLHYMRNMRDQRYQLNLRPTSTQKLLHVISERRRREKLNQNFQALRSLLPPETKKDKGSILTAAKEALNCLMAEIEKMTTKGDQEMKAKELILTDQEMKTIAFSTEGLSVRVSDVAGSSSSEERFMELQVTVRGKRHNSQVQILIRLLEFLKGVQRVSLVSVEANTTHIAQGAAINEATLRLRIEGSEWDEAAFREAVRRVVADLAE